MKTTSFILDALTGDAAFRPLRSHQCYRKFLVALPERFQKAIGFVYVRNATLYLALRHPGYKMELTYQKDLFLSLWHALIRLDPLCEKHAADSVILFNSKYTTHLPPETDDETIPYYDELAEGSFEDVTTDPDLHQQFNRLRALIQANRHQHDA